MKSRWDAYDVCRFVRDYARKNGYAPRQSELEAYIGADGGMAKALQDNGVIELLPLYEGGPALGVVLTDKGRRMAEARRR